MPSKTTKAHKKVPDTLKATYAHIKGAYSRVLRKAHINSPTQQRAVLVALIFALFGIAFLFRSLAATNPNLKGDLNGDNKVNITDLSILLSNFNKTTDVADLNGDGKVNVSDLSILLSNYGKTYAGNPTPTPTPPNPTPTPALPAPTGLKAVTGGNSVAVIWTLPSGAAKTEVYRNNALVATVVPGQGVAHADKLGTRYIDKSITKGTTYQYKVRSFNAGGNASAYSATISATPPVDTTPVPTVTIDNPSDTDLNDYLNTVAIPEIQTWYPKVSDAIAYPDYTPNLKLTIQMDPNFTTKAAEALWDKGTIHVNSQWLRANQEDGAGMFVHETTHIIQAYTKVAGNTDPTWWIQEGVGDWPRDWLSQERPNHIPAQNATLSIGYSEGAILLQWLKVKYNSPDIIRKINLASHNGTYTDSLVSSVADGKTPNQVFDEIKATYWGNSGAIKDGNGNCLDITAAGGTFGTAAQTSPCNNSAGQKWTILHPYAGLNGNSPNTMAFINSSVAPNEIRCLDEQGNGTADNTKVQSWACNYGIPQSWVKGANNSIVNPHSGKCLSPTNGAGGAGSLLVIFTCNGSAAQSWTTP